MQRIRILSLCFAAVVLAILPRIGQALCRDGADRDLYYALSLTKQRTSSFFYNNIYTEKLTATRFLPLFNLSGIGEWTSPRSTILINGIPYNGFLLNLQSVDLVPLDIVAVETIDLGYRPSAGDYAPAPGGYLALRQSLIPDSLAIRVRAFTGSETGDPLIYVFTRPEIVHINKNKVGPSFAASLSNRIGSLRYRISGGGFFYFSTGSVNDFILVSYDRDLINRQSRQIKISADGSYTIDKYRGVTFLAAGLNLFSWEMIPFTSTFQHYTQISTTFRSTYHDSLHDLSVSIVRDESLIWMKGTYNTPGGAVGLTEYTLYPSMKLLDSGFLRADINATLKYIDNRVPESKQSNLYQRLLVRDDSGPVFGFGVNFRSVNDTQIRPHVRIRYDKHYDYAGLLSGDAAIHYALTGESTLSLFGGTVVYIPVSLERYGRFETSRFTENQTTPEVFHIRGNDRLAPERSYSTGIHFSYKPDQGILYGSAEIFYRRIENPVAQYPLRIVRSLFPGEVIRSTEYRNLHRRSFGGGVLTIAYNPYPFLNLDTEFQFLQNDHVPFLPAAKATGLLRVILPLRIVFSISASYTDRVVYEDFTVLPENDFLNFTGVGGDIPSTTAFDLSIGRSFDRFYSLNRVEFRIEAQNIFNATLRRLPVGNHIDRAIFVYLSFEI
jgi:hypothetical protein